MRGSCKTPRVANIFGWRITKHTKGKHQVVLDQMAHGHHILRAYSWTTPLLENLAKPCHLKSQRMAGIRIENDRIIRLLEVLMHIFLLALQGWEAMLHSKWGWLVPISSRFRMRQAGS